jgi:hypothetical protein
MNETTVRAPDTNDGFLMIALELFPALFLADWRQSEATVLVWVLGLEYGPHKKPLNKLVASEIARTVGVDPSNIRAAIRRLIDRNVLQRNEDGLVRFNKRFSTWDPPVNPTATRFAARSLSLFRTRSYQHLPRARQTRNGSDQTRAQQTRDEVEQTRNGSDQTGLNRPASNCPPLQPPIEESRASERTPDKKEQDNPPNPPTGGTGGGTVFFRSRRDDKPKRLTAAERYADELDRTTRELMNAATTKTQADRDRERSIYLDAVRAKHGDDAVAQILALEPEPSGVPIRG